MTRFVRTFVALWFGGALLFAQLPNPLNLPDPLGLSKKPAPGPVAPRSPREGRRAERRPDTHRNRGRHKGEEKREDRERGGRREERGRGERKH